MEEIEKFILKQKQEKFLEIFLILTELSKDYDILEFSYKENTLLVKISKGYYLKIGGVGND